MLFDIREESTNCCMEQLSRALSQLHSKAYHAATMCRSKIRVDAAAGTSLLIRAVFDAVARKLENHYQGLVTIIRTYILANFGMLDA